MCNIYIYTQLYIYTLYLYIIYTHYIDYTCIIYIYILIYNIYETPFDWVCIGVIWSVHRMLVFAGKLLKTIGDSQKSDTFLIARFVGRPFCFANTELFLHVFTRLHPLHYEWACPCGGLTLHDLTLLYPGCMWCLNSAPRSSDYGSHTVDGARAERYPERYPN